MNRRDVKYGSVIPGDNSNPMPKDVKPAAPIKKWWQIWK